MLYAVILSKHFLKAIKGIKDAEVELMVLSRIYMYINGKRIPLQQAGSDGVVKLSRKDLFKIKKLIKPGINYIWFKEKFDDQNNHILEITAGRESLLINL